MSKLEQELLLAKWMEDNLSDDEQVQFETLCKGDANFAERVAVAGKLDFMSSDFQDVEVPDWDRGGMFEQPEKQKWWQWGGLSALSFATSMAAILMVTLRMEITTHDGAMTISFAGAANQKMVETLVSDKIAEFQQSQSALIADNNKHLQQQQMDMNTQLANYLLTTSRSERREDFAEFIKFVNEQRSDDQVFYARQLNNLKEDFVANSDAAGWAPNGLQDPVNGNE